MKNNKANPPGPNKPLVALVREDYINESVHFFGSAAKHVGREQDYNTQTSVNYSSAGIDYSSGPSRLLSSGGVAQRKLASNLADNSPAMPGNSRLLEMWKMSPIMPASSSPAKVKQMRDKGHSASIELFGQLRRVTKETVEDEDSSASPSRERGRLGRSRKHFDDSSKSSTSIKKEVDITTYVKEQRKIIKKVAGTTNGNKTTKPQGSTVRYEIKEFKKETPNSHLRYAKPIKSKKESNGNGYESMVEEAHQSRKFSSYQKQPIMSNIEKSKNSLRKVLLAANMVKTHEDSERKSIHHSKYRTIDDSCEELEGSRSRMLEHISKLTKQYEEPSYDARERFKQGIRQDGWLSRQTESEGSEYQKFSHPNLGMESQDNLNETRRPKSRLVSDSNPVLPLSINYDEKTTTRNRNRQDYSSQLNLTTEDSTPQNQKPNKPELLIIGDSQKPLSTHFKKKVPQVGKNRALRTGSVASEVRQPSLELSKIELRKKMLEYGKKIEKPKVNRTIAANESIDNMVKLGKAKSNPDLSFAFEKNMPKPEVLERLARGIKPKVDKSEIHEITRRHRERFERLNTQPNESPVRKNAKRAELLERKSKVKELDQQMEDQNSKFKKKEEPYSAGVQESNHTDIYKKLISKIQNKVSSGTQSAMRQRPAKTLPDPANGPVTSPNPLIAKPGLTKLKSINMSLIARISNQRGSHKPREVTSKTPAIPERPAMVHTGSRDRSNLKERINRLSTLERRLKDIEGRKDTPARKVPSASQGVDQKATSLLQKFKIQQLRTIPAENSKSSKGSGSGGAMSGGVSLPEPVDNKFKLGMEALKQRIRNLPGRQSIEFEPGLSSTLKSLTKPGLVNVVESIPIDVNLYKKKVDSLKYKREDQSSLRIVQARRAGDFDIGKKNRTATLALGESRPRQRESPLN